VASSNRTPQAVDGGSISEEPNELLGVDHPQALRPPTLPRSVGFDSRLSRASITGIGDGIQLILWDLKPVVPPGVKLEVGLVHSVLESSLPSVASKLPRFAVAD